MILESKGYRVTEKWECDYKEKDRMDVELSGAKDRYIPPFSHNHLFSNVSNDSIIQAIKD